MIFVAIILIYLRVFMLWLFCSLLESKISKNYEQKMTLTPVTLCPSGVVLPAIAPARFATGEA
jgi:hypothetical protein